MDVSIADHKDLDRLSKWCEEFPEFQKRLTEYVDRKDTAVLMMEKEHHLVGIAMLKVKETQKSGTIWLHLKEDGQQYHSEIMQESLKWLRQKGAKEFQLV